MTTHMVRHCFPQARQRLKAQSMLKAARGRYPKSSRSVNSGKKMAIGGSMTDTIQAVERYMPDISAPVSQPGAPAFSKAAASQDSSLKNCSQRKAEG